jgi:hypothetical protein
MHPNCKAAAFDFGGIGCGANARRDGPQERNAHAPAQLSCSSVHHCKGCTPPSSCGSLPPPPSAKMAAALSTKPMASFAGARPAAPRRAVLQVAYSLISGARSCSAAAPRQAREKRARCNWSRTAGRNRGESQQRALRNSIDGGSLLGPLRGDWLRVGCDPRGPPTPGPLPHPAHSRNRIALLCRSPAASRRSGTGERAARALPLPTVAGAR